MRHELSDYTLKDLETALRSAFVHDDGMRFEVVLAELVHRLKQKAEE